MKIELQVCTIEQAKRLKELGIRQDSLFSWCGDESSRLMDNGKDPATVGGWVFVDLTNPVNNQHSDHRDDVPSAKPFAAAFTVAELGCLLPNDNSKTAGAHWNWYHRNNWKGHSIGYTMIGSSPIEQGWFVTEAEARADMLIKLLEAKEIFPEEVNQRIIG